ncbi:MAG: RNA 2',3'-cyclic phosphodiesterase [Candidatus Odinarchaeota archaeon]
MNSIRAFIAVDVDESSVVAKISAVKKSVEDENVKIKFVEDNNLHLTLKFLGEVEEDLIPRIVETLSNLKHPSFKVELRGVGYFTPSYPRVLWIGIEEGGEKLSRLSAIIDDEISQLGFKKEGKNFTPHLTIGRIKYVKNRHRLADKIQGLKDTVLGSFNVENFKLKRSTLTPKGPIYETIREFRLEGV